MSNPKATVLMPVYNAEKYVGEAIESILNQTFTDFEFLIINDGSTDKSLEVIKSYTDPRIKIINNESNLGLSHTLSKGIEHSQGEYIARMDADDISLSVRLEKQIAFMDSHQHIGICGSWIQCFDESGNKGIQKYPENHDELLCFLFFNSCFAHPTVCIRKQVLLESGLTYKQEFTPAEDYYLWSELVEVTQGANLPLILLKYRSSANQMTKDQKTTKIQANLVRIRMLHLLNLRLGEVEQTFHLDILTNEWTSNENFFSSAVKWLEKISQTNRETKYFNVSLFDYYLANFLWSRCSQYGCRKIDALDIYDRCTFYSFYQPDLYSRLRLYLKQLLKS